MVVGQPRQDELLEFVLRDVPDDQRDDLPAAVTIDLSPLMSPLNGMPSKRVQWYCVPSNTDWLLLLVGARLTSELMFMDGYQRYLAAQLSIIS